MQIKRLSAIVAMLFAVILSANINTVSAQVKFGIKGGVDVVDHKINADILNTKNRLGFQIGPTVEFGLPFIGGIETSLLYGRKEYKTEYKEEDVSLSDYNYLTLPVNLKKRWGLGLIGIYIHGGPYATLKLSGGDFKFKDTLDEVKAKNFGMGLNFGFGVNLLSHVDLGLQYRVDLTDRYSENKGNIGNFAKKKHQSWTVGLTYFF